MHRTLCGLAARSLTIPGRDLDSFSLIDAYSRA